VPTFVANFLMPFGNTTVCFWDIYMGCLCNSNNHTSLLSCIKMKAYFALPDWVDDLNNIPEEKDDDPPGVKALKVSSETKVTSDLRTTK